jgi:hypothetical protein
VIGFTLVGQQHHPSAAYMSFNGNTSDNGNANGNGNGAGKINVIAEGAGPQDGFTEYKATSVNGISAPALG